ncbi:MAG: DUF3800 domain-containing protein [Nitrospiraceae bacterium]|nr:DUF3800 domain-containing protein [Nitrospiraceae bacterium]
MRLKAYYDGSGNKKNKSERVLTLSGFAAPEEVWKRFESEWQDALDSNGTGSFHMAEAMSLNGAYKRSSGWNEARVHSLVKGLFTVIGKFRSEEFQASSCSIVLDDYRKAKQTISKLRPPEAICVNFCIDKLWIPANANEIPGEPPIDLLFDQNEPFLNTINKIWVSVKNKPQTIGWPKQIRLIKTENATTCSRLQPADMFAWLVHRYHTGRNNHPWFPASSWFQVLPILAEHYSAIYDYEKILSEYPNG